VFRDMAKSFSLRCPLEKRALAQKAEADFFALLRESNIAQDGAIWTEASNCSVQPFNCSYDTLPSG
jgi:hypothetical protein